MIDALCHLELFAAVEDAARALEAAAKIGVTDVVTAGTDPRVKERVPLSGSVRVHRAYGIHPENARNATEQIAALEKKLDEPGVVAVGECGLDARDGTPPMTLQNDLFTAQLWIAQRRKLPVIVHGVKCPAAVIAAVKNARVRWVWHAFGESLDVARQAQELGAVISVGALVLNPRARKLRETLAAIEGDVLVETDAPDVDLTTLKHVVDEVARVRGQNVDDVIAGSVRGARALYGI